MKGRVVGPASSVFEALLEDHHVLAAVVDCQRADRDAAPLAWQLAQRRVPFVIHTATPVPPAMEELHADVPLLIRPLQAAAVLTCLFDQMRRCGCVTQPI